MSQTTPIQFFDGNRSNSREVLVEWDLQQLYVYDTEATAGGVLVFPLQKCTTVELGDQLFVYLSKHAAPYLMVPKAHAIYHDLQSALQTSENGWFGKLFKQKWITLVGILAALLMVVYFLVITLLPMMALKFISVQQEEAIGEKIYASMMESETIDSAATNVLTAFANCLTLSDTYPIQVTVIKETEVNAFALPGGHIVVYDAIIREMKTPESLVALLSHEATHINKRHSLKGILSSMSIGLVQSLVLSGFGDMANLLLKQAGNLSQLGYSRKLEREADYTGMELMVANKINPVGMQELMESLQKAHDRVPGIFSFISTHPLSAERIKSAASFSAQHKSATFALNQEMTHLWQQLKARP